MKGGHSAYKHSPISQTQLPITRKRDVSERGRLTSEISDEYYSFSAFAHTFYVIRQLRLAELYFFKLQDEVF